MVKKVDRALKDKSASSGHHDTDDGSKSPGIKWLQTQVRAIPAFN